MVLNDILFIAGQSGLFKFVSRGRTNIIIETLSDHKRMSVPITSKITMLKDISIFTETETMPLPKVFGKIRDKENGGLAVPRKSSETEIKKYFAEVLPEYDRDRVYLSDMRKVVMWYHLLRELGITCFDISEDARETDGVQKGEETVENK